MKKPCSEHIIPLNVGPLVQEESEQGEYSARSGATFVQDFQGQLSGYRGAPVAKLNWIFLLDLTI